MQENVSADLCFHRTVTTWPEFTELWGGLHNFLLGGEVTRFDYEAPPLERIIDEVRADSNALVRTGIKGDAFDLTLMTDEFRRLPLHEAMRSRFVLAHFSPSRSLMGKGQVFEGMEERWVEPWRQGLREHGFTFENVFPIVFASGPNSASNYHMDTTHQLAWQCYGTKHFCALKEPDHWTTREQRGKCELQGSIKPADVTVEDTYAIVQPPGTVLWNPITIPHWVETFDECAATLSLAHTGLRLNGELCSHGREREQWLAELGVVL